jgi:ATP-dependent exoDNAse (exonuclease V) beta subunit
VPPDQDRRQRALDPTRNILVQAPAGSGKTDLLTRRFLRLLAEVDEPGQILAITFTKAAAAEMRHRILSALERADNNAAPPLPADDFSMEALARRALDHSRRLGWNLIDLPAQLRISTIDSFCRELALQQPLLSGLGGGLDIAEQPDDLYRRAARRTLEQIDGSDPSLTAAIAQLLAWRDNNWKEMEDQLVEMLSKRDQWMHDFVLDREPNWDELRERLERPFTNAVREALTELSQLLDQAPGARDEALALARFACEEPGERSPWGLAESTEIPQAPFPDGLKSARDVFISLAGFLQTQKGAWRTEKGLRAPEGFPPTPRGRAGKARFASFVATLSKIQGLEAALAATCDHPSVRYTEEEWEIVRACFTLLRRAAGELLVVFAETGRVDYVEVAQIALRVLEGPDGQPTDAALAVADNIRHLLVDEFQDTSRRQYKLLSGLIAAWPERAGRTCFAVGDPMQSIYFFREADVELFARAKACGLEIPNNDSLLFDFVPLRANFRSARTLIKRFNYGLGKVFEAPDGSGVSFSSADPARQEEQSCKTPFSSPRFKLHLDFVPPANCGTAANTQNIRQREAARDAQTAELVELIRGYMDRIEECRLARGRGEERKYRVAVLGRARTHIAPIAQALREASIPFRAVDLENLKDRPEVLDALALARALLNPQDRVAWLGVLRAPWCGLSLADLHMLTSADDPKLLAQPVPDLLAQRLHLLSDQGCGAAARVLAALSAAPNLRAAYPAASLGTWIEQVWLRLGGAYCVNPTARANLNLLWSCLDRLPGGEQDLLGPALDAALEGLTALPDPEASSECGVQLMTIHKSKGLEFEVVIVPELQAGKGRGKPRMLSWLERGLAQPDDSGDITEFLIAPFPTKGDDRGKAKVWVDRVMRERETQEDRRILYTAATRAREELHLFARPAFKIDKNGPWSLPEPSGSLLATAWPALEPLVKKQFSAWIADIQQPTQETTIESIAASAENNLLVMPSPPPAKPTLLRRLPTGYQPANEELNIGAISESAVMGIGSPPSRPYTRHEGGLHSRALGAAVHALLQELARLRAANDWTATRAAIRLHEPRIAAGVRAQGFNQAQARQIAAQALQLAIEASQSPLGQWILFPHAEAASEVRWAGMAGGALLTARPDRVFRAGPEPLSNGNGVWWIVDYKTAHESRQDMDPAATLANLRPLFAPQLETYAQLLRKLRGAEAPIRAGLYYPRMLLLDWWEM